MREHNVSRIRRLLGEAVDQKLQQDAETTARRQFQVYEFNVALPALDPSPRAKAERQIGRIVAWYGWAGPEVARQLDRADVAEVSDLDDCSAEQLLGHLRSLEDCAQLGLGCPDAPSAT